MGGSLEAWGEEQYRVAQREAAVKKAAYEREHGKTNRVCERSLKELLGRPAGEFTVAELAFLLDPFQGDRERTWKGAKAIRIARIRKRVVEGRGETVPADAEDDPDPPTLAEKARLLREALAGKPWFVSVGVREPLDELVVYTDGPGDVPSEWMGAAVLSRNSGRPAPLGGR